MSAAARLGFTFWIGRDPYSVPGSPSRARGNLGWSPEPCPCTVQSLSTQSLAVPQYSPDSGLIWGNLNWTSRMRSTRSPLGVFSYSPNYDLLGIILTQAASASNISDSPQVLEKIG